MKNIILAIASFIATIAFLSQLAFAQEEDNAKRPANPGKDPSEEMTQDGAGYKNYGCLDPYGSCYKHQWNGERTAYTLKPKTPLFGPGSPAPAAGSKDSTSEQK